MPEVALQYARMPMKEESIRKHPAQIFRLPKIRFPLKMVANKKIKKKIVTGIIPIPKYLIPVSLISKNQLLRFVLNMVSKRSNGCGVNFNDNYNRANNRNLTKFKFNWGGEEWGGEWGGEYIIKYN